MSKILIKHADKYDKNFKKYCKENLDTEDCYIYEDLLSKNNFKNIIFYEENNRIVGHGYVDFYENFSIISSTFSDYSKKEDVYKKLSEDKNVLISDSYLDYEKMNLFLCDMDTTSFENKGMEKHTYLPHYYDMLYTSDKRNIGRLKEIFEEKLTKNTNSKITFENLTSFELEEYIRKLDKKDNVFGAGYWRSECGHFTFAGFHYFELEEPNEKINYLIAKQDDKIIGTIKYGLYDSFSQIPYTGINYIDVQIGFRNKSIAKQMIQELDKYLNKSYPLFLSDTSDLGKKYKMEEYFKKYITGTDVVAHDEEEGYCYAHRKQNSLER